MVSKSTSFARYSRPLCWFVAAIWLLLSILAFTGGAENATIQGFLWLAGAGAFAVSAIFIGRQSGADSSSGSDQVSE